jgi:SAM-dependent methyltransferase
MKYNPNSKFVGGFTNNDGTIDFYLRVKALVNEDSVVLDLGAGRAAWNEDTQCETRRKIRTLRGEVKEVIAADFDKAVLLNRASDRQILMDNNGIDLPKNSVDLVVADYVLEHIDDAGKFVNHVDYLLKPGGWFCARTPHKWSYVALAARLLPNSIHVRILKYVQPDRLAKDIFPTTYQLNTHRDVKRLFPKWSDKTFTYKGDPAYFFGVKWLYIALRGLHSVLLPQFTGVLFVFVKKPNEPTEVSGE